MVVCVYSMACVEAVYGDGAGCDAWRRRRRARVMWYVSSVNGGMCV